MDDKAHEDFIKWTGRLNVLLYLIPGVALALIVVSSDTFSNYLTPILILYLIGVLAHMGQGFQTICCQIKTCNDKLVIEDKERNKEQLAVLINEVKKLNQKKE